MAAVLQKNYTKPPIALVELSPGHFDSPGGWTVITIGTAILFVLLGLGAVVLDYLINLRGRL